MLNWKLYSLLSLFFFGSLLSIACIIISFIYPEPIDSCHTNLRTINSIYGIIGSLTSVISIYILIRLSRPEKEFSLMYILGLNLKPLPGNPTMYTKIKPGAMTPIEANMHTERLQELKRRYTAIITLTTLPTGVIIFIIFLGLCSIGWSAATYAFAANSNCTDVTLLRIWSFVAATLVLIHIGLQIFTFLKLRPLSMRLTTAIDAYKRGLDRHQRFLDTNGQTWSESDTSSESDSTSSDSESDYSETDHYSDSMDNKHQKNTKNDKNKQQTTQDCRGSKQISTNSQRPSTISTQKQSTTSTKDQRHSKQQRGRSKGPRHKSKADRDASSSSDDDSSSYTTDPDSSHSPSRRKNDKRRTKGDKSNKDGKDINNNNNNNKDKKAGRTERRKQRQESQKNRKDDDVSSSDSDDGHRTQSKAPKKDRKK